MIRGHHRNQKNNLHKYYFAVISKYKFAKQTSTSINTRNSIKRLINFILAVVLARIKNG